MFTDTRQGCELFSRVLGGAGASAFASFCAGGGLVLITEGALRGKTTANFSAACVPFNVCGSVVGTAFLHSRNGFVISNRPLSPANQPSEECAAKTRWSCCSIRIASSFLPANVSPCRVHTACGDRWYRKISDSADRDAGWKGMDDVDAGGFKFFGVVGAGGGYIDESAGPTARGMHVYLSTCGRTLAGVVSVFSVSWAEVPGGQKCARPQALAYALRCGTTPPHGKLNGLGAAPECVATGPVSGAS